MKGPAMMWGSETAEVVIYSGWDNGENEMNFKVVERKPGRPRAVPKMQIHKVLSLYRQGLGYRAVAREMRQEGVSVDWSTIRRIIKAHTELEPR
jgi:hypothetical protein